MESVSFLKPPPLIETLKNQNLNKFCDYHEDRGHNTNDCYQLKKQIKEVMASGKLAHLVKDIYRNNQWNVNQRRNNVKVINMIREEGSRKGPFEEGTSCLMNKLTFLAITRSQLMDEPIILEGITKGIQVRRILVDGGSSLEIMYEHYFRNLDVNIRSRIGRCKASMIGFSGETYHPLGVIDLRVTMGREARSKTVLMEFAIIKLRSSYNIIIGRTKMRSLGAIGSTIHSKIKFLTNHGVITMETSREALREFKHLEKNKEDAEEVATLSHERPDQYVTMGATLTTNCKQLLEDILRENMEDMYPFPEEGEELASLMGYPYKCFFRLPKEYSQIRMAEDDEEKVGFHTEEGVYCFTYMPKELKNSDTSEDDGKDLSRSKRTKKFGNTLGRNSNKKQRSSLKDRKEIRQVANVVHSKRRRRPDAMSTAKKQDNKFCAIGREGRNPDTYFLCKEAIEEGLGVGIILVSPEEKMYSYVIRLKFKAPNYAMDCEALLAGLAASANQGVKDLHVFIDSLTLVAQVEGNHTPATKKERKIKRGNYGCNGPIPQVLNHTSPKNLKPKSKCVNRVGNYKARNPQLGSIGRYQNKTIGRRDKQQQESESIKQCTMNKTKLEP
ncbi:reverse transcriptase domain-containing protein [Tanacetum coccineum]